MNNPVASAAIQLKAGLYTLAVLQIYQLDLIRITQALEQLVQQTPHFFRQLPLIVDIQCLTSEKQPILNLGALSDCLRQFGLIPVGLRGGTAEQQMDAQQAGWALFSSTPILKSMQAPVSLRAGEKPSEKAETKLITTPVRSGQQIYAANDLVVLANVSPGAELLAEGHIHIYGKLSGRALAGISDNSSAYIFCHRLEAELVSIAGHYWLHEDLQKNRLKSHIYLFLKNNQLHIRPLLT